MLASINQCLRRFIFEILRIFNSRMNLKSCYQHNTFLREDTSCFREWKNDIFISEKATYHLPVVRTFWTIENQRVQKLRFWPKTVRPEKKQRIKCNFKVIWDWNKKYYYLVLLVAIPVQIYKNLIGVLKGRNDRKKLKKVILFVANY